MVEPNIPAGTACTGLQQQKQGRTGVPKLESLMHMPYATLRLCLVQMHKQWPKQKSQLTANVGCMQLFWTHTHTHPCCSDWLATKTINT
jgi:hypothetical protein